MEIKRKFGNTKVTLECKVLEVDHGIARIKEWIGFNEALLIFEDRKKPLCVLTYDFFKFLVDGFEPKAGAKLAVDGRVEIDRSKCFPYCDSNADGGNNDSVLDSQGLVV